MIDMDKIEKIRQEIERLRKLIDDHNYYLDNSEQALGYGLALDDIEQFLDTLSEEPDKSLEEAAEEKYPVYWKSYPKDGIVRSESSYDTNKQCRDAFIAGAEWQARQLLQGSPMPEDTVLFNKGVAEGRRLEREDMMKDAVGGYVNYYEDSGGILMAEAQVGCPYHNGDKVRIVVLKEEEE